MADAAHWLVAAEGATGFPEGAILDALETVQRDLLAQTAVDDTLTVALLTLLVGREGHEFEGRYGQLFELLVADSPRYGRGLPASPAALSTKLKRMQPGFRQIGLEIEDGARTSSGRTVVLRLADAGMSLAREIVETDEDEGGQNDRSF